MQIELIEVGDVIQALRAGKGDCFLLDVENTVFPELLKDPVHVNRRQAESVSKVHLGHRKSEMMILQETYNLQPFPQLRNDVGEPCRRIAPADVDDPLAKDCRVHEGFAPESSANIRPFSC